MLNLIGKILPLTERITQLSRILEQRHFKKNLRQ